MQVQETLKPTSLGKTQVFNAKWKLQGGQSQGPVIHYRNKILGTFTAKGFSPHRPHFRGYGSFGESRKSAKSLTIKKLEDQVLCINQQGGRYRRIMFAGGQLSHCLPATQKEFSFDTIAGWVNSRILFLRFGFNVSSIWHRTSNLARKLLRSTAAQAGILGPVVDFAWWLKCLGLLRLIQHGPESDEKNWVFWKKLKFGNWGDQTTRKESIRRPSLERLGN